MRRARMLLTMVLATVLITVDPAAASTFQVQRGRPADLAAWEPVVQVQFPESRCTGVIIAPGWVISAAHCGGDDQRATVVGPRRRADDDTWRTGADVLRHPRWNGQPEHDLALLQLDVPHRYAGEPIRLADTGDAARWAAGSTLRFAGWGTSDGKAHPEELQEGEAQVSTTAPCWRSTSEVCINGASSPCFGDSGGPFLGEDRVLVAISARVQRECSSFALGLLVAPLRPWIDETIAGSARRIAGRDRYETAAAVARSWRSAPTVFVAGGDGTFDAIAAGPVAARAGGPLLLTARDHLSGPTRDALRRLRPTRIVIAGGTSVVSRAVEDELRALATVERYAGADRTATAAALSAGGFPADTPIAFVVAPSTADALTAASVAALRRAPLLFVDPGAAVPPAVMAELQRLRPEQLVAIGDYAEGSPARAELESVASTTWIDDQGEAARAASLLERFAGAPDAIAVIGSSAVSDGVASVAAAGLQPPTPTLLTSGACLPRELVALAGDAPMILLGGPGSVSDAVVQRQPCTG